MEKVIKALKLSFREESMKMANRRDAQKFEIFFNVFC